MSKLHRGSARIGQIFFVFLGALFLAQPFVYSQIQDPIPTKIPNAGFNLILREFIRLPSTSQVAPKARINMLKEADDGSGRLFVNDLEGYLYSIQDGKWDIYLNVRGQFDDFISGPGKGTGFGAFAFHPDFQTNGLLYTSHAEQANSAQADLSPAEANNIALQWVVNEWKCTDPGAARFEGTRRELLRADFPDVLHGIQEIAFNTTAGNDDPDYGMLYICIGDGGSSKNFQEANLDHPNSYMGTIFRIDPAGTNGRTGAYGIPPDNPFAGDENAIHEVWVMGFRNPHRITWDDGGDHKMLIGDIGEMNIEEVNIGMPGAHYGWSKREGTFLYDRATGRENVYPLPANDSIYGYAYPAAMYDHDEGHAIVGGFVYRNSSIPEIENQYIFGDIVNGRVFMIDADSLGKGTWLMPREILFQDTVGNFIDLQKLENNDRADLRFGKDLNGNIYVLTKADGVIRTMHSPTASLNSEIRVVSPVQVFPNPATEFIRINPGSTGLNYYSIKIVDSSGKMVDRQPWDTGAAEMTISTAHLHAGIYYMELTTLDYQSTFATFVIK